MMLRLPGQRTLNMLSKKADRDAALRGCLRHGPRRIYSGLLHHARSRGWKDGSAYYAFIEIFGAAPRRRDQGPPVPPPLELKAWISLRPKRSKN
jgi:hypothetical protein